MSALTPSAHWGWQVDTYLTLKQLTGITAGSVGDVVLHQTPFTASQLHAVTTTPSAVVAEFTLAQAEWYWRFWQATEPLLLSDPARFAATIDALASQQFVRQTGHKSWGFSVISSQYQPQVAELVLLSGASVLLAVVTQTYGQSSQLLLLDSGENLQHKQMLAGQNLVLLNDRLQAYRPQRQSGATTFAKTA